MKIRPLYFHTYNFQFSFEQFKTLYHLSHVFSGLFHKVCPPPLWATLSWVPKNFRISKKGSSSLRRISNPADSEPWEITEFCKILNGFPGIPVKIHKILGKFLEFQSDSPSICYRISDVVHGGGVDIFWNSPVHQTFDGLLSEPGCTTTLYLC